MRDPEELREIDALGQEEAWEDEWQEEPEREEPRWGGAPLFQGVLCGLALLLLLYMKYASPDRYQEAASWYQREMSQEIELPRIGLGTPAPSPSPEPAASPAPSGPLSPPPEAL